MEDRYLSVIIISFLPLYHRSLHSTPPTISKADIVLLYLKDSVLDKMFMLGREKKSQDDDDEDGRGLWSSAVAARNVPNWKVLKTASTAWKGQLTLS